MIRQSLFLLFLLLFFTGCMQLNENVEEHSLINREVILKDKPTELFSYSEDIIPIIASSDEYFQVVEWFDENQVIYLTEEYGFSILRVHHLLSGEQRDFFKYPDPIIGVKANEDQSYFAVTTSINVNEEETAAPLLILDQNGDIHLEVDEITDEFIVFWNPYDYSQMIIIEFLPDWDFELHHLNINEKKLTQLDLDQTYLQWINKNTVGYLNWSWLEPNFSAPLKLYNLKTEEKKLFLEDIIAFFTFSDELLVTLSVESIYDLNTKYTFYRGQNKISEVEVPILGTFSEQWWIPFHDYNNERDLFFYLRPLFSGTFIDYKDPYQLIALQVESGKESVLLELDTHAPIKASPNGKWLLYGYQFEEVIDIGKRKIYSLIDFYS